MNAKKAPSPAEKMEKATPVSPDVSRGKEPWSTKAVSIQPRQTDTWVDVWGYPGTGHDEGAFSPTLPLGFGADRHNSRARNVLSALIEPASAVEELAEPLTVVGRPPRRNSSPSKKVTHGAPSPIRPELTLIRGEGTGPINNDSNSHTYTVPKLLLFEEEPTSCALPLSRKQEAFSPLSSARYSPLDGTASHQPSCQDNFYNLGHTRIPCPELPAVLLSRFGQSKWTVPASCIVAYILGVLIGVHLLSCILTGDNVAPGLQF